MPFETDKNNGFKLDATDLLKTGVYPEAFDRRIPFWETVDGMQYTEFGMRRKAGRDSLVDLEVFATAEGLNLDLPIRGITAVREFNDKVAYIGDLGNIYSYAIGTSNVNLVGEGYNLIETSAGTLWSDGGSTVASIIAASHSGSNQVTVTMGSIPTQTVGNVITVRGIPYTTTGQNPNVTNQAIDAVSSIYGYTFVTYTVTGTTPETYINLGNARYTSGTGGTTWDLDTTTWDESINQPDLWDFEPFGSFIVAGSGSGRPVIKKDNVNFNLYFNTAVSGASVTTGGTGYVADETFTATGASSGSGLTGVVRDIVGGSVVAVEIDNFGLGYTDGDVLTITGDISGVDAEITVTVPDIDFTRVQGFKKQGPHMLAYNYSKEDNDFNTSFAWCSADDLDTWQAAAINTAGSLLIREANSELICMTQLGNSLAAYTENQLFVINYVGQPNIFGYRQGLEGGVGAVSSKSVVTVGRNNYGLSRDGFFYTDGASVKMIGRDTGMNKYFRDNASSSELRQVVAYNNAKENEVIWAVPINSNKITKEIYYNYKTNQWGMRDSNVTAYFERGVFNNTLSADENGMIYNEGASARLEENPAVSAITKAHDMNNADRVKELTAMRVGKEGTGTPTVSIGWSSTIDAEPTYKDSFIVRDSFNSFPLRTAGRYLTIKVESDGELDDWTITDMVMQGRFEGER